MPILSPMQIAILKEKPFDVEHFCREYLRKARNSLHLLRTLRTKSLWNQRSRKLRHPLAYLQRTGSRKDQKAAQGIT